MRSSKVLLLNASNMESYPVYPYAFIQVPAIARRAGVEVICKDLLGIPQEKWQETVQGLIEASEAGMILITLRNTDSLNLQDYEPHESQEAGTDPYFPVERTRELIHAVRAVTDIKIALGGFGFSLLSDEIMRSLRPDFGVFGGPDGFFARFKDIQTGNLGKVANLLYFQGDRLISNPRTYYPPLADTEYTPETIEMMMAFYTSFPTPGFQGAPVEVIRGCNHSCVFCAEPHVVGKLVRYRDISAVMGDIEILVNHGITRMYMISSELNPEGNEYVLQLAERIRSFNERQTEDRQITWFGANYLLNFEADEFDLLYKSGFTGGWFDITALDDENARTMQTPYRNKSLIAHLKTYVRAKNKQYELSQAKGESQAEMMGSEDLDNQDERAIKWSMFLGNPATTTNTIRETLRVANKEGLAQLFTSCSLFTNIRVFNYETPDESTLTGTYSFTTDLERTEYHQLLPSFAYPPRLLQDFGSEEEIKSLFRYLGETYLSTKYQETRDWLSFLKQKSSLSSLIGWIEELSDTPGVQMPPHIKSMAEAEASETLSQIFSEDSQDDNLFPREKLAEEVVNSLLSACLMAFPQQIGALGLPSREEDLERMTPYELAVTLFNRWSTEAELMHALSNQTTSIPSEMMQEFIYFCVPAILYRYNVLIKPKFRSLFIADHVAGSGKQSEP